MVKPTVLYLDDESPLLDIFSQMFSDEYDVRTASTLAEARQLLKSCTPAIIISDWSMPEVSGLDFLREAAEACPDSFRIILTGYGQVGDAIGEISAGLVELFITKPWTEDELRKALERAREVIARRSGFRPGTGNTVLLMALSHTLLNVI